MSICLTLALQEEFLRNNFESLAVSPHPPDAFNENLESLEVSDLEYFHTFEFKTITFFIFQLSLSP